MAKNTIGAGWKRQSNSGEPYITIKIEDGESLRPGVIYSMVKNNYKKRDNHPDYVILRPKGETKQESDSSASPAGNDDDPWL